MRLNFLGFRSSIRPRLIFLFIIQVVIIFSIAGLFLQWQFRNKLEAELGLQLETVAILVSVQLDGDILTKFVSGDENTRSHQNLVQNLQMLQTKTAMRRILVFDRNLCSLADTRAGISIGREYIHLKLDASEINRVWQGQTVTSVLFAGEDGRLYKSGYAPIITNGEIIAAVRIEGSAQTLESIQEINTNLLRLGLVSVMGAVFLAILFSNRITQPLKQLQTAATEIGKGNYSRKIPVLGKDEVGFLARTLDEMRQNIIQRDIQQKAMLAGVAHEIRNPLGGIELFAGILSDELSGGKQRQAALKILKEVKNLKKIIQDFLDYARPAQPVKQICSIRDVFHEVVGFMGGELENLKIEFCAPESEPEIEADPQHLKQIFMNLLHNARQAMDGTGVLRLTVQITDTNRVDIIVADNGPGIPAEDRRKIFDPFFTTRPTGIGLGLAIVKNLVQANGGKIRLLRDVPTGATFIISFPGIKS